MRVSFALTFILMAFSSQAMAQATRTWVSGVGDDANPCSRTAPCKTFAGAISKTAAGGEIDALDPGGFGAVTITKAITIDGGPNAGGILSSGTHAIIINAPTGPTGFVTIRNLNINGANTGLDGVRILNANTVTLDNVHVQGVTGYGVRVSSGTPVRLAMNNVSLHDNNSSSEGNIGFLSQTFASLTRVFSSNAFIGLQAQAGSSVSMTRSVFFGHTTAIDVAGSATVSVEQCMLSGSTTGISNAASTYVSGVMTSQNTAAFSGTAVSSFGNNPITDPIGVSPSALPLR